VTTPSAAQNAASTPSRKENRTKILLKYSINKTISTSQKGNFTSKPKP